MKAMLLLLLLVPQLASAKVYICRDEVSGKTTFTDTACDALATREEVRVPPTNVNSGRRTAAAAPRGAWLSDRDTRKTGRDYNSLNPQPNNGNATAVVTTRPAGEEES